MRVSLHRRPSPTIHSVKIRPEHSRRQDGIDKHCLLNAFRGIE